MIIEDVLNNLYKSYGTDSGILFGISSKNVVRAIVKNAIFSFRTLILAEVKTLPTYSFQMGEQIYKTLYKEDVIQLFEGKEK